MVVGVGVDLFDVARMEAELRAGDPGVAAAIFTPAEIATCATRRHPAAHFALRFAAKEALVKALGADTAGAGLPWRDIDVRLAHGHPRAMVLQGPVKALADQRGVARILLSVARARGVAAALVVLESHP